MKQARGAAAYSRRGRRGAMQVSTICITGFSTPVGACLRLVCIEGMHDSLLETTKLWFIGI